jgi:lantibiotic biosynthesis protein
MNHNRGIYKTAAITIADKICRDAIWQGDTCNWMGLATETTSAGRIVFSQALPPDLYDGVAGVIYFLLQVYRIHPHPVILKTLKGALQQLVATDDDRLLSNGFYQGKAGVVFVIKVASQILDNQKLAELAEKKLSRLLVAAMAEEENDIISGIAGIILLLINLYRQENKKKSELLLKAEELGALLLKRAENNQYGTSWKTLDTGPHNLTGYAHGAAGIATALAELYSETKNEKLLHAIKEAIQFENSFFNEQQQNWPDLRFSKAADPINAVCSATWCHGAAGIGLARIKVYEITGDKDCFDDVVKAFRVTVKVFQAETIHDYSLCHGLFGQAIFILKAASLINENDITGMVYQQAEKCLQEFVYPDIPVPNGYHSLKESPCYMQGNSGVGHFFLHLYDPFLFPVMNGCLL